MKYNYYRNAYIERKQAIESWNRIYEQYKRKEIDVESLVVAITVLNSIDKKILYHSRLTNEEKDRIFDECV